MNAARLAVWAHFAARRAQRALELGLDAVELAAFSDAWADALSDEAYRRAELYATEAHNGAGLFDWERAAIERFFPTAGRALVTSAGGGREARVLAARGLHVAPLAAILRARLGEDALHAAPDAVPSERGPFGAAIVGWTAYSHLVGRARRVGFLRRLAGALAPGAPVLVSYWQQPSHDRGARLVAAVANAVRRPLGRRPVDVGETTRMGSWGRWFAPGEAAAEIAEAGLALLDEGAGHLVASAPRRELY